MTKTYIEIATSIIAVAFGTASLLRADLPLQVFAYTGETAPTPDAQLLHGFSPPVIGADGQIFTLASLVQSTGSVLLTGTPNNVSLLLRTGQTVAGTAGDTYTAPGGFAVGGGTSFVGMDIYNGGTASGSTAYAILGGTATSLGNIAAAGDPVPQSPGQRFGTSYSYPTINNSGQAAFAATIASTSTDQGVFVGSFGNLSKIAITGDPAPGASQNFNSFADPMINNSGQVAFTGQTISGGSLGPSGIWVGTANSLSNVVLTHQSAPGTTDGSFFSSFNGLTPELNNAGAIAFRAQTFSLTTGLQNEGIWTTVGGQLTKVALPGDQIPGQPAGTTIGSFSFNNEQEQVLNDRGQIVFVASVITASTSNYGLFLYDNGNLKLLAQSGQAVPGLPGISFYSIMWGATINNKGQIVFDNYQGSTARDNLQETIFAWDPTQGFSELAYTGELLPSATGGTKTVTALGLATAAGASSRPQVLNDNGQVVFNVSLRQGPGEVVETTIPTPEPATVACLLAPIAISLLRARHSLRR